MTETSIRRGYVDTALGQMHYRHAGHGDPVVMLHWGPASSRMMEPHLPLYAAKGYHAVAFDMIGHGQSAKLDRGITNIEHAEAVSEAMTGLDIGGGYFIGGHMPSAIAVEVVLLRRDIRKLILDGTPLLNAEETKHLMSGVYKGPWGFREDGSHKDDFWNSTVAIMKVWNPDFTETPETLPQVYALMADHIEASIQAEPAIKSVNDFSERLALVDVPVLVLTAEKEPLRNAFERAVEQSLNGRGHVFPGCHPVHYPERASEYVDVATGFFASAT